MRRLLIIAGALFVMPGFCAAQQAPSDKASEREREAQESSSHDTRIDISPPADDEKKHPYSKAAVADMEEEDNAYVSNNTDKVRDKNEYKASFKARRP